VRQSRRESAAIEREYEEAFGDRSASQVTDAVDVVLVVAGLVLLVLGSQWLVDAAVADRDRRSASASS
jgi:cation:H+ antiporter